MSAYASNWSRMQSKVTKKKVYRGPVEVAEKQESEKKGKQKKKSLSAIARATWSNAVEDANSRKQVKLEDVLGLSSELGPSSTSSTGATSHVAMDCEMVGAGPDGQRSILARCSLVNFHGHILYDKFVQPKERVTDFRTEFSGIRYNDILKNPEAVTFEQCQKDVFPLLRSRVLIGHSIQNDLKVLMLDHPGNMIRDTAYYKGLCPHRPISLKHLMDNHLNVGIQEGEHDSVTDARAVLALYRKNRVAWEMEMDSKRRHKPAKKKRKKPDEPNEDELDADGIARDSSHKKKKKKRKGN